LRLMQLDYSQKNFLTEIISMNLEHNKKKTSKFSRENIVENVLIQLYWHSNSG
jgi:uncharacterized protein (UPF0333 family)